MGQIKLITSFVIITTSLIIVNHLDIVHGQVYAFGDCPKLKNMDKFDIEKFEGSWYVIEKFGAVSRCVRETVARSNSTDEAKEKSYLINAELEILGVPLMQSGNVEILKEQPKSMMKINFPAKYDLDPANYWVLDTDYENWAVVWSCNEGDEILVHQESAQIMSRIPTLDPELLKKLKLAMGKLGIAVSNFIPVSQNNCLWDLNGKMKPKVFRYPPK